MKNLFLAVLATTYLADATELTLDQTANDVASPEHCCEFFTEENF